MDVPGWRRSTWPGWLGLLKVLRTQNVLSVGPLFREDQFVAPGHEETVALFAVFDDELAAAAQKLLARYGQRLGFVGVFPSRTRL
jgi:hypothetical protein